MHDDLGTDAYRAGRHRIGRSFGRYGLWGSAAVFAAVVFYYLIGAALVHKVDDNLDFKDAAWRDTVGENASKAVGVSAALLRREVEGYGWVANNPFFLPGSILDNMPNFQVGIVQALSRFGVELTDQIGRTRGSSQVDADLEKAAGLLKYPPDVWLFDFSTSWAPTASSDAQYRAARRSLISYNERLANGNAVFDARADNLLGTLDRVATDLGSASAVIDSHLREGGPWPVDYVVDDIFYRNKGKLYAYYMLLTALGEDFEAVLRDRQLGPVWAQMLASLREAAELDPLVVVGGAADGLLFPNHLTSQGFFLLRARTQLREVTNILLK
ncbi:MAG: DUF2333 family protein [Alphaproteobacteria bacterium]|nr:DUF2333 family protein [Alphaproteobacteria bacterium]